ncbi:MAG TPA: hypothetical protein VK558_07795 [Patescibacteria group bacterium]|nr:hypothetical protein [Patescibacteria group bacterium]
MADDPDDLDMSNWADGMEDPGWLAVIGSVLVLVGLIAVLVALRSLRII